MSIVYLSSSIVEDSDASGSWDLVFQVRKDRFQTGVLNLVFLSLGLSESHHARIVDVESPGQPCYTRVLFTASCRLASWRAHGHAWRRSQQ